MTDATTKIRDSLNKPFNDSVIGQLPRGGKKFDFVPVAEVIARMNAVLGTENWSEKDTEVRHDSSNPEWIIARTTVVATIDGVTTEKVGYGSQRVNTNSSGDIIDLGNDYKGAHSDAFKKACTKFGVALHLARDETAIFQEIHDRQVAERAKALPATDEEKQALKDALAALEDEAALNTIKQNFRKEEVPSLLGDEFTEAHAKLVRSWIDG